MPAPRAFRRVPASVSSCSLLLLALCAGGCFTIDTTIEGQDDDVFFPTVRASFDLNKSSTAPPPARTGPDGAPPQETSPPPAPSSAGRATYIDVELSRGEGDFTQTIGGSQFIDMGSTVFTGPDTIDFDVALGRAAAGVRHVRSDGHVDGSIGVGISVADLELDGRSGATVGQIDETSWMINLGLEVGWRAADELRLFAGLGWDEGFSGDASLDRLQLGAEVKLSPEVSLAAGWQEWEYDLEQPGSSDVDIELSGLFFALRLSL